ncbi:Protein of unknown function [Gryllus bimaculatus]|nr:Protein of unknown function [Gryllus bimaculatus]
METIRASPVAAGVAVAHDVGQGQLAAAVHVDEVSGRAAHQQRRRVQAARVPAGRAVAQLLLHRRALPHAAAHVPAVPVAVLVPVLVPVVVPMAVAVAVPMAVVVPVAVPVVVVAVPVAAVHCENTSTDMSHIYVSIIHLLKTAE